MSLGDITNAATTIGVLVAIVGLYFQSRSTRRAERITQAGQKQEAEIARNSAARAEAAAALNEEYTRRVVEALETLATRPSLAGATKTSLGVRWSLAYFRGDTYILTNEGAAPADNVKLSSHRSLGVDHIQGGPRLGPGEAMTFMSAPSMATSDMTITVSWNNPGDEEERTWRYPLPYRR
jgi:hypothetical protein